MPRNEWIDKLLSESRESHKLVTDAAVTRMRMLLQGKCSECVLNRKELIQTADDLIADMTGLAPKDGEHENK